MPYLFDKLSLRSDYFFDKSIWGLILHDHSVFIIHKYIAYCITSMPFTIHFIEFQRDLFNSLTKLFVIECLGF